MTNYIFQWDTGLGGLTLMLVVLMTMKEPYVHCTLIVFMHALRDIEQFLVKIKMTDSDKLIMNRFVDPDRIQY